MAKNFVETTTKVQIATDKSKNSFYEYDKKQEEQEKQRFEKINKQAEEALFDNSHSDTKLKKVYEKLDKSSEQEKKDDFENFNPFYGDKNALNKLKRKNYNDVVCEKEPEPTLEVKEEIVIGGAIKREPKTKRKKLWLVTGAICIALFAGLLGYNMISLNSLAKNVADTQAKISQQEQVLERTNEEYLERLDDLGIIASEGMVESDTRPSTSVDLTPKNSGISNNSPSNAWDKLCNFFAKIFGR